MYTVYMKILANDVEKMEFRCYSSKSENHFGNLNSISELIRLQPDIEYEIQITYNCYTENIYVQERAGIVYVIFVSRFYYFNQAKI